MHIIRPHEVRVGNQLLDPRTGEYVEIDNVYANGRFNIDESGEGILLKEMEGIPIDEDLLLSLGFVFEHTFNADQDEIEWMQHPQMRGVQYLNDEFYYDFGLEKLVHISYFHQLQNLFFDLTGEYLKLK